jgi:hypothetical protein
MYYLRKLVLENLYIQIDAVNPRKLAGRTLLLFCINLAYPPQHRAKLMTAHELTCQTRMQAPRDLRKPNILVCHPLLGMPQEHRYRARVLKVECEAGSGVAQVAFACCAEGGFDALCGRLVGPFLAVEALILLLRRVGGWVYAKAGFSGLHGIPVDVNACDPVAEGTGDNFDAVGDHTLA